MNRTVDYVIAGQGIAGTVLAQTLLQRGNTVLVIDDNSISQASRIAAGLYNPVVFKRLTKSWKADELIAAMDVFYPFAEKFLKETFYHKKEIIKIFTNENEKDFWLETTKEEVGIYLSNTIQTDFLKNEINAQLGTANVTNAGNLDVALFLTTFRNYLKTNDLLLQEKFDYKLLSFDEKTISYKDVIASKIIFCEGFACTQNPYFNWLPFKLTKGEVLTVKIHFTFEPKLIDDFVINKGCFILPLGNNIFKVGATYEWNDLTEQPTDKGKEELIEKLKKIINVPFEILKHEAGIRPTVIDRRPLIGFHPKYSNVAVFNGMGTKAVMLAPYFANHFADVMEGKVHLDNEVNCNRFN